MKTTCGLDTISKTHVSNSAIFFDYQTYESVSYLTFIKIDIKKTENFGKILQKPRARFLMVPKRFRTRKAVRNISNLMSTELFYSYILNMNRGSLPFPSGVPFIQEVSGVYNSS